jgi:enolase
VSAEIASVHARRVWDSRGRPTVEAEVVLASGVVGRAIAPAGASRGSREAIDLRDGGSRFGGMDVMRAIANIGTVIGPALAGLDALDQQGIDAALVALDGTPNKARLGGNATVAVSLAVAHAAAAARGCPLWRSLAGERPVTLPLPEIQIFGGGAHAGRRIDIQDLMVMPVGATSFAHALEITAEVYRAAGELMSDAGKLAGVADEGGWWPHSTRTRKRSKCSCAPSTGPATPPAPTSRSRWTSRPPNSAAAAGIGLGSSNASSTVMR